MFTVFVTRMHNYSADPVFWLNKDNPSVYNISYLNAYSVDPMCWLNNKDNPGVYRFRY